MSATAYERRQAVAVYCEYCCASPGHPCAAYNGPSAEIWPPTRTHTLRVETWRREAERRSSAVAASHPSCLISWNVRPAAADLGIEMTAAVYYNAAMKVPA